MSRNENIDILNRDFPSKKDEKKGIIDTIASTIKEQRIPLAVKDEELYLSIDEAVTNAMEHGNGWKSDKPVSVKVTRHKDCLLVSITDQGKGFDAPSSHVATSGINRFKKRGRGLFIISKFCDITWNEKGNRITLSFPLKNAS